MIAKYIICHLGKMEGYVQLSVSFHSRPNLSGYIVANIFNT